ncbi:MAG TPA: ABC transporter permease [Edaphobacter sp.]|nr:ABC transporter permease [Edaphobacter sp.]
MFKRKRDAEDFAEEIQSHLELEADELQREGLDEKAARRKARQGFGNAQTAREQFNMRGRWMWLDRLLRNVRFGLRSLRQSPGFTITAVLTLALGIGANTAVFSVMNAVLLRSLPVSDPQSVVYVKTSGAPHRANNTGDWETSLSYPVYDALRQQKNVLSEVMAYVPLSNDKIGVRIGTQPETAEADMVSGNFFSGLGVKLERGRGFLPQDEANHSAIAVISYDYWTRRFSRNPDVLGKTLYVKGVPITIVGITAPGFEGVEPGRSTDFWIPLQNRTELNPWGDPSEKTYTERPRWWFLRMLARLAPGISREQAAERLQGVFRTATYVGLGSPMQGEKPPVLSFDEAKNFPGYAEQWGKPLHMLMAMVGLVLLIALANVVMLLMARNATRQREFSLRLALGAGRGELLRQLLAESFLLVIAGGLLAWGFAFLATDALGRWAQIDSSLAPDRTVLLFTLGILAISAVLFGLAPFRVAIAGGAELALKTSAATAHSDAGKTRTGKIIVAMQMALCVVLLAGAGLLIRTLRNLQNIPLGMQTDGLVVFGLNPQNAKSSSEKVIFYQELIQKLRTLPGVSGVTIMSNRIGSGWSSNNTPEIDGRKVEATSSGQSALVRSNDVGPDFFHTLGVPLIAGREFTDADTATSQKVAVVSELFAQRFFPNQSPLGHQLNEATIIGVAKNSKYTGIAEDPIPMAWFNYAQNRGVGSMHIEMKVKGDPLAVFPMVSKVVAQMDPNAPLIEPITQQAQFEKSISTQLMFARLAEFFGLLAVVLVATGLYGTLAYRVNTRTAEIGVRMAVGARRGQVIWMILKDSLLLTAIGVVAGVPLAMMVTRSLASALYGVKPLDTTSYLLAVLGVVAVSLAASAIPAKRAATVDPITALHAE